MRIAYLSALSLAAALAAGSPLSADPGRKVRVAIALTDPCACDERPGRCERVAAAMLAAVSAAPVPAPAKPAAPVVSPAPPTLTIRGVLHSLSADGIYRACPDGRCPLPR